MKKFLVIALLAFASCAYSGNTIIAIVNKAPITLNSVQVNLQDSLSKDGQIVIINNYIDNILQVQKATELELIPTKSDIENVLNDIAQSNNLTLIELMSFENYLPICTFPT